MTSFIDAHREQYGVEPICRELPIAPSTYYEGKAREADRSRVPARAHRDAELGEHIARVWEENSRVYGVRKVWRQLQREGIAVARCTVARLMRELGLRGVVRGSGVKTTTPAVTLACPADRVNRVFQAPPPETSQNNRQNAGENQTPRLREMCGLAGVSPARDPAGHPGIRPRSSPPTSEAKNPRASPNRRW